MRRRDFLSVVKRTWHARIVSASHRSQGNQSAARRKVAIRRGRRARHFAVKLLSKLFPRQKVWAIYIIYTRFTRACVGAKRLEKEVKSGLSSWARCNCSAITRPIDWIKLQSAKNWFCPARRVLCVDGDGKMPSVGAGGRTLSRPKSPAALCWRNMIKCKGPNSILTRAALHKLCQNVLFAPSLCSALENIHHTPCTNSTHTHAESHPGATTTSGYRRFGPLENWLALKP